MLCTFHHRNNQRYQNLQTFQQSLPNLSQDFEAQASFATSRLSAIMAPISSLLQHWSNTFKFWKRLIEHSQDIHLYFERLNLSKSLCSSNVGPMVWLKEKGTDYACSMQLKCRLFNLFLKKRLKVLPQKSFENFRNFMFLKNMKAKKITQIIVKCHRSFPALETCQSRY